MERAYAGDPTRQLAIDVGYVPVVPPKENCLDPWGVWSCSLKAPQRDTHASLLAKAGVPIEVVSQRLGHSCIGVTVDRYVTVYRERDAAAAAAFARLVA